MKKITLLVLTLCMSFMSYAQFPETFDTEIPATWAIFPGTNGLGTAETWEWNSGGYPLIIWEAVTGGSAEDWLVSPQVAITASNSVLTFDTADLNDGDYLSNITVRVSSMSSQTNIPDFTTLLTINEGDITSAGFFQPFTVDLSAYIGSSVYIAFVMTNNDGDAWVIDNVDLVTNATAPEPVINPTPADGATDVFVDPADGADADTDPDYAVAFDWDPAATGDAATSYDVYLGDSETTLNLLGNTPNDNVNITGMEYGTQYYWQIVAKNVGGDAVGSAIWSFTTQADPLSVSDFERDTFTHFYDNESNTLNLESTDIAFTSIEIYSILGQKALTKSLSLKNESINVSNLSTGVYLAKVNINGNYSTVKFIKK